MDDIKRDYTGQTKTNHSPNSLANPYGQSHQNHHSHATEVPAHVAPIMDDQYVNVSIRISVPDVSHWRIAKFIKEYPYFSSAIAIGGLIVLLLLIIGLTFLWHTIHPHKQEVTMLLSNILNAG